VYVQKASISSANILMAYHVPQTIHEDYYALAVLSDILSKGNSSRLIKSMVYEQKLASRVFSYTPFSIDPNLFYIYAVAGQGVSAEQLEKGLIEQVNLIARESISENELQKVKNSRLVNFYREMATINGKANTIGTYEFYFGDYQLLFDAPQKFAQVSIEDVQRVAKKYLRKANRTVGILAAQEDSHENDL
jgi:predicted Zn-dependent peptidase